MEPEGKVESALPDLWAGTRPSLALNTPASLVLGPRHKLTDHWLTQSQPFKLWHGLPWQGRTLHQADDRSRDSASLVTRASILPLHMPPGPLKLGALKPHCPC